MFENKKINKLVRPKRNENSGFCLAFKENKHSVLKYLLIENKDIYLNEEINSLQDDVHKIILDSKIEKETGQYFETLLSIRKLDLENKLTIKYNNFPNKIKI